MSKHFEVFQIYFYIFIFSIILFILFFLFLILFRHFWFIFFIFYILLFIFAKFCFYVFTIVSFFLFFHFFIYFIFCKFLKFHEIFQIILTFCVILYNNFVLIYFLYNLQLLKQHRSLRSALSSKIKDAMFSVFGEAQLDSINANASPAIVAAWKASQKTKSCYKKLFTPISDDDINDTYIARILTKAWPGVRMPTNLKMAYTITICQIMLSDRYDKLKIGDDIVKNRLRKNIVNILLIF